LLRGAELPFEQAAVRRMRSDAAAIQAERLHQPAAAIALYRGLLEEDAKDETAAKCVEPLAELLERTGEHAELAALWEQQATHRMDTDPATSARLWSRAAGIAENQLDDLDRAVSAHENAAELSDDPRQPLEALERIHTAGGDFGGVAHVLERLATVLPPAELPPVAIRLADTYLALGDRTAARERLERAVEATAYDDSLAARLATLYEEGKEWGSLAELHAAQGKQAKDRKKKLGHLRKAAELYLTKKEDRERAVPLLQEALGLAPDTSALSLSLADALIALGRLDQARDVLARQIERYADRRPKHRAQVHFALGRVLNAAGDRKAALAELETATRIDPAHATVLQSLARLAREEGLLERAQQAYEALLLLRRKSEDDVEPLSRSGVLLELAKIADDLHDPARAEELRESAQVVKKAGGKADQEIDDLDAAFIALESAE
jgi:tetratricopeptide (TPR) repeat protein